jgi:hypothetical protein
MMGVMPPLGMDNAVTLSWRKFTVPPDMARDGRSTPESCDRAAAKAKARSVCAIGQFSKLAGGIADRD